jgi:predicted transcriptional regulator
MSATYRGMGPVKRPPLAEQLAELLARNSTWVSTGDLVSRTGGSPSGVSKTLGDLARAGSVERRKDPAGTNGVEWRRAGA